MTLLKSTLVQIGAVGTMLAEIVRWVYRATTRKKVRLGRPAIMSQIVRIGVRSVLIVSLVSGCVGFILVLQMTPPLDDFGRKDLVANIVGVAVLRELGPLIAAIVLTGFAGAAIAAEIGTMVVGEEIEALEAQALNPVRFLVVPRVIAATISMGCLAVLSNFVAIGAGLMVGLMQFDIPAETFFDNLLQQAKAADFLTGWAKSFVFGAIIGLIACTNGIRVTGGAEGVGKATTDTVVQSVVAIVIADLIFTYLFVVWGLT
ncbi:MAG: ABC transporter permease [Planctomycetaceae bacterium]|nr:ABC transporter permease [Phycisphaerales bacterium]MCE2653496.1 ABC transporter permease [Planctomycetaceae bacterium]